MVKLRAYRAELASTTPTLRVYRAELTGTVASNPKLRVYRAQLTGTLAANVLPFPNQTVEPGSSVVIPGVIQDGVTPDSLLWRVVSGPAVTFVGTGASRTFVAPSATVQQGGVVMVVGVRAQTGSYISEQTATITVLPQLRWVRYESNTWLPRTRP